MYSRNQAECIVEILSRERFHRRFLCDALRTPWNGTEQVRKGAVLPARYFDSRLQKSQSREASLTTRRWKAKTLSAQRCPYGKRIVPICLPPQVEQWSEKIGFDQWLSVPFSPPWPPCELFGSVMNSAHHSDQSCGGLEFLDSWLLEFLASLQSRPRVNLADREALEGIME